MIARRPPSDSVAQIDSDFFNLRNPPSPVAPQFPEPVASGTHQRALNSPDSQRGREFTGKSQGGGRGRRADHRGDAAFGAGGAARMGAEAGGSDGAGNSSTTSDASAG